MLILHAFVSAALLAHYDNWDPVVVCLRRVCHKLCYYPCDLLARLCPSGLCQRGLCSRKGQSGSRDQLMDREQSEMLINA